MTNRISRKAFLRKSAGSLSFVAAGFAASQLPAGGMPSPKPADQPWPWPYKPLDPEIVRKAAHDGYYEQGCGYAVFAGIILELRARVGRPFTLMPLEMMSYAGGGIKGWGTICGAVNGAGAVISLVCDGKTSGKIIDELILWYTESPLPSETSNGCAARHEFRADKNIAPLPQSISGSPLCHVSATKWCKKAGSAIDSPQRHERCARLSGDVAAFAVKALNYNLAGRMQFTRALPEKTSGCLSCHGQTGEVRDVAARFDCVQCHTPHDP